MEQEYYDGLVNVCLQRAEELLTEAIDLLEKNAYKSANNRAFYVIEKCIKALLALKQMDVTTHSGVLKQFKFLCISKGDGTFTADDYQIIARAEQVRKASDYDDFYIASEEEAKQQVESAKYFVEKVVKYVESL